MTCAILRALELGKMTHEEMIKRFRMQLEGLASWPDEPTTDLMRDWILNQIEKVEKNDNQRKCAEQQPQAAGIEEDDTEGRQASGYRIAIRNGSELSGAGEADQSSW